MQYAVSIPVTMHISILVESPDETAAKDVAFQAEFDLAVIGKSRKNVEIVAWEMHNRVAYGNVYEGVLNEVEVESVD